jgi:phenylacetate-CoA ligase
MRADPLGLDAALGAGSIALDVLTASHLDPSDIAKRSAHRLTRLLESTLRSSAFYHRKWRDFDVSAAAFARLPVVGKRELMQHFGDWVTDPRVALPALRAFVADPSRIGEPFLGEYIVWEGSGSSGEPATFVQDAPSLAVYDALEAGRRSAPRTWERLLDPLLVGQRHAFVGATNGHFASVVTMQRLRRVYPWLTAGWRGFSILQPTPALVEQLNDFSPALIATYPTAAELLADEAECGNLRIAPNEIWTGGEALSHAVRQRTERVFGCALRNSYGASEFLPIAWECGQRRLHVNSDWVILEPVDECYRPVPAGRLSHTALLTNLANEVQPLVRYDLGDQVMLARERCACGSPLPVIEVLGRRDDALHMAGRDGRPVTLLPLALTTVLEDTVGVFDFQLEQLDDRTLNLHLGPTSAQAGPACRRVLQAFAAAQGLAPLRIVVRTGQALRKGTTGKVRRVVARPEPGQ